MGSLLMTAVGLFVLMIFTFFAGILASWVFDRFRFLRALLPQLLFLAFLITPVIWQKEQLGDSHWVADLNPLSHLLEIVRAPLLESSFPWGSQAVVIAVTAVMAVFGIAVHRVNREMILYRWVA